MHGPAMSGWLLVTLCGATGAYCLVRMRSCSGGAREAAGGEALMGLGMAAMALPTAVVEQTGAAWVVYASVFALAALRGLVPARHSARHLHHLVGTLTMVYMAAAMAATSHAAPASEAARSGHPASGIPLVTAGLLAYYTVYVLRSGLRLTPVAAPAGSAAAVSLAARTELAPACRIAMALAMLAMLLAL